MKADSSKNMRKKWIYRQETGNEKKTEDRDEETEQKEKYQETRWAIFNAYVKEGFRFERWKWGEE